MKTADDYAKEYLRALAGRGGLDYREVAQNEEIEKEIEDECAEHFRRAMEQAYNDGLNDAPTP